MITLLLAAALAAAPPPPPRAQACINVGNSSDTHYYPVDDHTIVIESSRRWFKLGVTPTSMLTDPSSFIVSEIRGSTMQCAPIDFQLSVDTQPGGFRTGMIAQSFTQITPAEGEALRKAARR